MHEADWAGRFERTPGGPDFALANVALMRLREVEIHHADLGAGYSARATGRSPSGSCCSTR